MTFRTIIKRIIFLIIYCLGLHLLVRRFYRNRVLILMYHGLTDKTSSLEWTQLPIADFEKQMKYISAYHNPTRLSDAVDYLGGNKKIGSNPVVVTFDDGYNSNYTIGYEVLKKYDIPAIVFISTSLIENEGSPLWFDLVNEIFDNISDGKYDLDGLALGVYSIFSYKDRAAAASDICDRLKALSPEKRAETVERLNVSYGSKRPASGSHSGASWQQVVDSYPQIEAGAHTINHEILSTLSEQEENYEIAESKKIIESKTGKSVDYFAYPNGTVADFTDRSVRIVSNSGYRAALTTIEGFNNAGDDIYKLKRIGVGPDTDMLWFKMAVTGTIDLLKKAGL